MNRQINIFSLSSLFKRLWLPTVMGIWMLAMGAMSANAAWADGMPDSSLSLRTASVVNGPAINLIKINKYLLLWGQNSQPIAPDAKADDVYEYRDRPSADGIGKFYLGREIAQVMGHRGAAWLERPSRIQEEKPHVLMANLDIEPTDVIADIGAGTGYLTVRLAPKVPQGKVLAVDVQPEMLEMLGDRNDLENIELILASETDPHLPEEAVDMAIMLDVYHELESPYEVMQNVVRSLRPGGKMVLVEYRGENPLVPIKRLHKMTEKQVRKEMKAVGLTRVETNEELPRQHLLIFEK